MKQEHINSRKCGCGNKVIAPNPLYPDLCNLCMSKIVDGEYNNKLKEILQRSK